MRQNLKRRLAGWLGLAALERSVHYLLVQNLNTLSAVAKGPAGHAVLRQALLHCVAVLKPTVFCDVGALDGAMSLAVRAVAPGCEIHAFEADPENHALHAASLAAQGIVYRNIAVSDVEGRARVHAPRGHPAGKTSLLLRNEEVGYRSFDVETRTLDGLFRNRLGRDGSRFILWVDVEGATERVLAGARHMLEHTLAVFVECETKAFWRAGGDAMTVTAMLVEAGFVPVARDREYGDDQFNVLFVAARALPDLAPALFDAGSPLRLCLTTPPSGTGS